MSPLGSYHQFLGNGIDAVLLGPSGAMTSEPAQGLDRGYWYKADLYYGDPRTFAAGDDPRAFTAAPPGGTNYQLAPLARAWYQVRDEAGAPLPFLDSRQDFSPSRATLTTHVQLPNLALEVTTFLAAGLPVLVFELRSAQPITVIARAAPGLWPQDREQTDPIVEYAPGFPGGFRYRVGDHWLTLRVLASTNSTAGERGVDSEGAWARLHGTVVRWGVALASTRYPEEAVVDRWNHLPASLAPAYPTQPSLLIPDPDYQRLHQFSLYMFRAMQHRHSGGLPVNNLRRTFNSHVFWDGAFVQRTLLEAGYTGAAREAWRFLGRTSAAAGENARDTFQAPGLHWDWETTHRGERAYLPWLQQRFQVHNTPLLAHMVMEDFAATGDLAALAEGFPLLEGATEFVLHAVLVKRAGILETRPLVGSHEAAAPVVNDGATVAACLRLLRDTALAARLLGHASPTTRRAAQAARLLRPSLDRLFNGRYFQASRDEDRLNTSSLAPIYPAGVISPTDRRARQTAQAYRALYAGRLAGHGNGPLGFPWSAGILARILAFQGRSVEAWEQLDLARPALCAQGGSAEYCDEDGRWNSQYFSTAQAALCSALHALVLQAHGRMLHLFPALPTGWDQCSFRRFQARGLSLDASYEGGRTEIEARNPTDQPRGAVFRLGAASRMVQLGPGSAIRFVLEERRD